MRILTQSGYSLFLWVLTSHAVVFAKSNQNSAKSVQWEPLEYQQLTQIPLESLHPRQPQLALNLSIQLTSGKSQQGISSNQRVEFKKTRALITKKIIESGWWSLSSVNHTIHNPVEVKLSLQPVSSKTVIYSELSKLAPQISSPDSQFKLEMTASQQSQGKNRSYQKHYKAFISEQQFQKMNKLSDESCRPPTTRETCLVSRVATLMNYRLLQYFLPHYLTLKARKTAPNLWQVQRPLLGVKNPQQLTLCYPDSQNFSLGKEYGCREIGASRPVRVNQDLFQFVPSNWSPDSFTEKDFVLWPRISEF